MLHSAVSRRDFLRGLLRLGALGALAALTGNLLLRSARANPATERGRQTCRGDRICRSCASLGACPLPEALSFRERRGGVT